MLNELFSTLISYVIYHNRICSIIIFLTKPNNWTKFLKNYELQWMNNFAEKSNLARCRSKNNFVGPLK